MNKSKTHSNNITPSKWINTQLNLIGYTFTGLSGKNKEDFGFGKPYIPYLNIFNNAIIKDDHFDYVNIKENDNQQKVKHGDIFFTTSSESAEEVGMCSVYLGNADELYLNSFCFGFRISDTENFSPVFLAEYFRSSLGRRIMFRLAQGATRYNLSKTNLLKENITIPPLPEQQKIADILSTWDEAIALTKKTIDNLKDRNKGLAQKLLSNKKSKHTQLSKLLKRIKKPLIPDKEKKYQEIGIRSHAKGIFYKEEVSGLSLGNKSVFHIEPNCFILNIVFAWEHAIAKTTTNEIGMIASHRFPMYKPLEDKLDLDYLLYFFKSKKGKHLLNLASPGGAGRNKTLGQNEFLKLQIPVPDFNEQKHIAQVLETADQELKNYEAKLEQLQLQKKGLMQQLLTGKIRVNLNK